MSVKINVPEVGESITEVTIATWLKKDGDFVEQDEIIAELESDKATFELPAEASGKLTIKAEEGETLEIGALICEIDDSASPENGDGSKEIKADAAPEKKASAGGPQKTGEIKEMVVPSVGESITEVTISTWLKEDGDYVELDEIIAEVESDKATFELPAEASGMLQIVAKEGDTLEIGATICKIEVTEGGKPVEASSSESPEEASEPAAASGGESYAAGHASPAAAKILKEKGIDPSGIQGTGIGGRITKEDAEAAQKTAKAPGKSEKKAESTPAAAPSMKQQCSLHSMK